MDVQRSGVLMSVGERHALAQRLQSSVDAAVGAGWERERERKITTPLGVSQGKTAVRR